MLIESSLLISHKTLLQSPVFMGSKKLNSVKILFYLPGDGNTGGPECPLLAEEL